MKSSVFELEIVKIHNLGHAGNTIERDFVSEEVEIPDGSIA